MSARVVTLIPARGGSKGIPRKNIALLGGKPLIAHSIAYSLACPLVERTIVSTDDPEIAEAARSFGAEVPFMRPEELARDHVQDYPVFRHALEWLRDNERFVPELVVQLRPTSPLRPAGLIEEGLKLMRAHPEADCLRTVNESVITPYKLWNIEGGYLAPFVRLDGVESWNMSRQLLPKVYWHNGVLDIVRPSAVFEKNSVSGDVILPLMMRDPIYSIDIDRPIDLLVAEAAYSQLSNRDNKEKT
ncbi:MAG: acylneuraminate cytidylyltransferase family protein [Desulfovibrionaceae bacterium]|nr:acylneuraminate cytidylyltransferase family protein [Desulfovibrionaceae bacterium]MBF0512659.1 acylneuraminate cytidylyltransferase family protein [Desulfovibrionaceae bacterium]